MKELKTPALEPYEAPAIIEIMPVTMVRGEESGNPVEEPDDPGSSIPD